MSQQELDNLRSQIEATLAAYPEREITEDGELLFDLSQTQFRLEVTRGRLLLHLWSPERNWVRRVIGITEDGPERLVLEVERFGQKRPGKLVVATPRRRAASDRQRAAARRTYSAWFGRLLAREFPRSRVEGLTTAADLKRSFSGLYTRTRLREGERWWAVLGVNAGEDASTMEGLLTYALIWLEWNRQRYPDRVWAGLRLFLPAGRTQTTANRLVYLAGSHLTAELFAVDQEESTCARVEAHDVGNLETHLTPARRGDALLAAQQAVVEQIRALEPGSIEAVVSAAREEVSLRFRGLEFARVVGGQARFGIGHEQRPMTSKNLPRLRALVERLRRERVAEGSPRNPCYRAQPERWLESVVRAAPQRIDPRLRPEQLVRQVPAVSGGERGLADLLGVTREGQLVVIELKASTDIHLPLQGLEYWLRVRWHQQRGELATSGTFPGVRLRPDPPELLLVAPALQVHPTAETVVSYFSPEVPVTLIGINEDWRRQLRVVFRRSRSRPPA